MDWTLVANLEVYGPKFESTNTPFCLKPITFSILSDV
jgi:hypothetical protein